MKMRGKRLTALLLALCAALGLTACGSGGDKDGAEQLSGMIYVPSFIDLDADFDYIRGGCCDGKNAYIVASVSTETEVTDPETGETYTDYDYRQSVYRIDLETGELGELEDYAPNWSFDDTDDGWFDIRSIEIGPDGGIWVTEEADFYEYDLPEDFDEETGSKWQYRTSRESQLMRKLDSTGQELDRVDISGVREALSGWNYINYVIRDGEGGFFVSGYGENGSNQVAVLDKDGSLLFTLDNSGWGAPVVLGDGSVALRRNNEDGGSFLSVVDKAAKGWSGAEYPLPYGANEYYNGTGKYLFYYNSGESLYGYDAGAGEGEKLLSWSDADINVDSLVFFALLEDGRIAAMTQNWGTDGPNIELAVLKQTDRSELPEKTTLTFATMYLDSSTRSGIIKFNKSSDKYRIEIHDYSEYNTADDYQAGLTKLSAEILAGNVPDILAASGLPMRQYEAKGLLEDLWPFIDSDPEISRDTLMIRVFEAAEKDGKLYESIENFGMSTVIGSRAVVGDEMGWTLEELKAALAAMPEGCAIFNVSETKSQMLQYVLALNVDGYVDWDTGECRFDSDGFKAALEFCNSFPLEYDWEAQRDDYEGDPARIMAGRQMLLAQTFGGFDDFQMYEAMFAGEENLKTIPDEYRYGSGGGSVTVSGAGDYSMTERASSRLRPGRYVTFIGFPMEDGSIGSTFTIGNSMSMSSACKDKEGAWSFIRELLLPQESRKYYSSYGWNFPTNKADFDAMAAKAMEAEYVRDGEGNVMLDQDGEPIQETKSGWSWDPLNIDIVATTQEEYGQIMELYNAIDSISSYDTSIYEIVNDLAGSYFNGDKGLDETADLIQGRVQLYINESR